MNVFRKILACLAVGALLHANLAAADDFSPSPSNIPFFHTYQLDLTRGTGTSFQLNVGGTITTSANNTLIYQLANIFGTSTNPDTLMGFNRHIFTDSAGFPPTTNTNEFIFDASMGTGGFAGNRNVVLCRGQLVGTPSALDTSPHTYVACATNISSSVNLGGAEGSISTYKGSLFAGNDLCFTSSSATFIAAMLCREADIFIPAGSSVAEVHGFQSTLNAGMATRGIYDTEAFDAIAQPGVTTSFECAFCVGARAADWPLNATDGVILGGIPRQYSGNGAAIANYGIDLRAVTFSSGASAFNNAGTDPFGNEYAANVVVGSSVSARSGTLTGITSNAQPYLGGSVTGGLFGSKPTLTIAAPPNSGTRAVATVATMSGAEILGALNNTWGNSGQGYSALDVLTAVGGTGTPPTFHPVVDGSGAITAYTLISAGAWVYNTGGGPAIVAMSGGSGTGAFGLISFTSSAPSGAVPWYGGHGFAVNDVITATGGTCSIEPVWTVTAVTSTGGVKATSLTTAGACSVLPTNFVTFSTNGAGLDLSASIAWSIASYSISNAGTNYLAYPPPIITIGWQANVILDASVTAVITDAAVPLNLNNPSVAPTTWADNQTCTAGQFTFDAGFLYVCTATNTVKRAALSTF